ncbi:hypothetical protein [Chromobacterium violaceum]|nr:hypothetical protein [Chromobacterium violaceum]MBX9265482.1 hypothetical protein [Chromobacterium violaceum]MCD0493240.1 hypothetical protein [Chromobacterium violaceum]
MPPREEPEHSSGGIAKKMDARAAPRHKKCPTGIYQRKEKDFRKIRQKQA